MGMFSDPDCAGCKYCDLKKEDRGRYYCEKLREYVSANANAKNCRTYGEKMGGSAYDREQARKNSKKHGYYVMTAISNVLGLGENNVYLESFKKLRDEVLPNDEVDVVPDVLSDDYKKTLTFEMLINRYEDIGPVIADGLSNHPNAYDICRYYEDMFLKDFVILMENGEYISAALLYFNIMFPDLKEKVEVKENIGQIDFIKEMENNRGSR